MAAATLLTALGFLLLALLGIAVILIVFVSANTRDEQNIISLERNLKLPMDAKNKKACEDLFDEIVESALENRLHLRYEKCKEEFKKQMMS